MDQTPITASLLRASAAGFAGLAAARLAERPGELVGADGFDDWRAHLANQVAVLAESVEDEAPELFAASVAWSRDACTARALPPRAIEAAFGCLAEVLEESLPAAAWAPLAPYFQRARAELQQRAEPPPSELTKKSAAGRVALAYLEALESGDDRRAIALVFEAIEDGRLIPHEVIEDVLVPVQREIGRRWHQGQCSVAEEHFVTQAGRKLLALVLEHASAPQWNGRTVIVGSVAGDAHDFGVQIVAAYFDLDGWRSVCLGADTPVEDLVAEAVRLDADLVALGATLDVQRATTARAVAALREARPGQKVLVGGAAFAARLDLWRRVGADAWAATPSEAVDVGRELAGL
jgi:methanogenic corrinoid protein MtbC1